MVKLVDDRQLREEQTDIHHQTLNLGCPTCDTGDHTDKNTCKKQSLFGKFSMSRTIRVSTLCGPVQSMRCINILQLSSYVAREKYFNSIA